MENEQAAAICLDTFRESKKKSNQSWQYLNFNVPIEQTVKQDSKNFLIRGVAINSTVTRNGVEFIPEELMKSAASLRNKPILKDHDNSIDSIVGRTTDNVNFNQSNNNVEFEAKIMDKEIQEKIDDGRIQSVSVGAMVNDLDESVDEDSNVTHVIARGIDFVELSLVAVPADPNAGLAQAIMQSFNAKKQVTTNNFSVETPISETHEITEITDNPDKMEEQEKLLQENLEMKEKLAKIEQEKKIEEEVQKRLAEALEKTKVEESTDADDTEAEKIETLDDKVDETQGEVGATTEESVEESSLAIEPSDSGKGFSMYLKEYDTEKYKRLTR